MRTIIAAVIIALMAAPAWAYTPHVGDRAAPITGRDVTSNTVMSLEDYLGDWVFIDFWASWCGPCMGELPNMLAETKPYRKSGDLTLFTVSLDAWSTVDRMHDVFKEYKTDYPVIFDGGGWDTVQSKEWGVRSIPATFLVNPQGVIVASNLRGDSLAPALDFFINHEDDYAPVGLRTSHELKDDGSVLVRLELSSPTHAPLEAELDYYYTRYTWAEDDPEHKNRPIDREYIDENEPDEKLVVAFDMFGDQVIEVLIPALENTHQVGYSVSVLIPGTEDLLEGNGIKVSGRGRLSLMD